LELPVPALGAVRQLEARVRDHAARTNLELPAAARALRVLEEAAPIGAEAAARQLAARGHARGPFAVRGLLTAAEVLGLDTGVHLRNGVVLRVGDGGIAETLVLRARRVVRRRGATRVEEIALAMGAGTRTVRRLLELQPDVHWLDERHGWFVFEGAESRATGSLEKMLSVSPTLAIAEVDEGLRRSFRAVTLPLHVVRSVCGALPWLTLDRRRDTVSTNAPLDPARALSPLEQRIVAIFRTAGPTLTFSHVVELALRDGLNRSSVAPYLTHTPVVKTVARGRYTLRGEQ